MWLIKYCIALPIFLVLAIVMLVIIGLATVLGLASEILLGMASLLSRFLDLLSKWGTYNCPWRVRRREKEAQAMNEAAGNHPREDYYDESE